MIELHPSAGATPRPQTPQSPHSQCRLPPGHHTPVWVSAQPNRCLCCEYIVPEYRPHQSSVDVGRGRVVLRVHGEWVRVHNLPFSGKTKKCAQESPNTAPMSFPPGNMHDVLKPSLVLGCVWGTQAGGDHGAPSLSTSRYNGVRNHDDDVIRFSVVEKMAWKSPWASPWGDSLQKLAKGTSCTCAA